MTNYICTIVAHKLDHFGIEAILISGRFYIFELIYVMHQSLHQV